MEFELVSKKGWEKTVSWLEKGLVQDKLDVVLNNCGEKGVKALEAATPKRTGVTARSWRYEIRRNSGGCKIVWMNDNKTRDGDSIAFLLQYGHGTGRGGYVKGRDYINPAMRPVFDEIAEEVRKAVMD